MKDIFEALFKSSRERIRNPLLFSFIISWLIYNWKSILILVFSDLSIEKKIETIKPKDGFAEPGFFWPLLVALLFVIVLPYILHLTDLATNDSFERRKKQTSERRVSVLKHSIEEVKAEVELEKLRMEYKDVTALNERLKTLEEENDKLEKEVIEAKKISKEEENQRRILEEELKRIEREKIERVLANSNEISHSELRRLKFRYLMEFGSAIEKRITIVLSLLHDARNDSQSEISQKFLDSLDQMRSELNVVRVMNATYDAYESSEIYENLIKVVNALEDNIEDNTKRIVANIHRKTDLSDALGVIFKPLYQVLNDLN